MSGNAVRISEEVMAKVRGAAQHYEITYSQFVEEAVKIHLKAKQDETGKRFKKVPANVYGKKAA